MDKIEKIRNEIERLNNKMDDRDPLAPNQKAGYLFALADVLSFLSTLESEKPMQEGLEEELDKWRHEHFHGKRDDYFSGEYLERTSQLDLARHFAQWGAEHLANSNDEVVINGHKVAYDKDKDAITMEEIPNDLEKAAEEWVKENYGVNYMDFDFTQDAAFRAMYHFRAGANWQKEQDNYDTIFHKGMMYYRKRMMEEAVEGWIDEDCIINLNNGTTIDLQPNPDKVPAFLFEYPQDVRVIVLPKNND